MKTKKNTVPSNVCWSMISKLCTSISAPISAGVLFDPGLIRESEPGCEDEKFCAWVLADGLAGTSPVDSCKSSLIVSTPKVC